MKFNKGIAIALFCVLAVAQIAVSLSMIAKREDTLKNGTRYLFKTMPVDPYDAFRGKYVALGFVDSKVPSEKDAKWFPGQHGYAHIRADEAGRATLDEITKNPGKGNDFIKVVVRYALPDGVLIDLPFDRYYMEEKLAPKAEAVYRERVPDREAFAAVRVKAGFAVLEELYIGEVPIHQYLEQNSSRQP